MLELLEFWAEITSFQPNLKPQSCHLSELSTTLCLLAMSDTTRTSDVASHSNLQKRYAAIRLWSAFSDG